MAKKTNHLADQASLYLQQHANNPVDWYPWSEDAINRAKQENKPIFLSIGYSACHWCHVMAHESFEDKKIAAIMNEHFINIKVDREERPDLDKIYQIAHQLLSQHTGGWPLTVFLSPDDLIPFYTGTYFPPTPSHGLPSFKEVLMHVAKVYQDKQEDLRAQNSALNAAFAQIVRPNLQEFDVDQHISSDIVEKLSYEFDKQYGGFSGAPKFPQPMVLIWLLQTWRLENQQQAFDMLSITLKNMALGGIFDHVDGGFFRYSVDEKWMIPHFEKMLYDNGQLLSLYTQYYAITKDKLSLNVIKNTAAWLMHSMQSEQGGYYASMDADSEGVEGKYYAWKKDEIISLLNDKELEVIYVYFNILELANFEDAWHLHAINSLDEVADKINKSKIDVENILSTAIDKLKQYRSKRVAPSIDKKIIISWNALAIKGMLLVGTSLSNKGIILSAMRALEYIYQNLWKDGVLHNAYLDDYAYLLDAILIALQIKWDRKYLSFATELADVLLLHFQDKDNGGFYFTADNQQKVIFRPKQYMDDSIPSGNAIAAIALQHLGYLLSEDKYLLAAEKTLKAGWANTKQHPGAHAGMLLLLENYLQPEKIIIIRSHNSDISDWQKVIDSANLLNKSVFVIPADADDLPTALENKKSADKTIAYVCQGHQCLPAISNIKEFSDVMSND